MPRPRKCRRVCSLPRCTQFAPTPQHGEQDIIMMVDEYEAIRLIDYEGLTQEQCAQQLEVARATAQAIYASARKKLAECIVQGRRMVIDGGDVQVCERRDPACNCCCGRRGGGTETSTEIGDEPHE